MIKIKIFLATIIITLFPVYCIHAQDDIVLEGQVLTFNRFPLNNVSIKAIRTGYKTLTDSLGFYQITCNRKEKIEFRAYGFVVRRIKAGKISGEPLNLIYSNTKTSFRDAISGGHIKREDLEMAIRNYPLKGEKDFTKYSDIYQLIESEVYNVNVEGTSITTKQFTSFLGSQEVLLVVNGSVITDISFINPNDVKSIRYVNDAESSKYGLRGANGALEIVLK